MHSDPIADMLTRIRNANAAHHRDVAMPQSRIKSEIARLLREEGFIDNFEEATPEEGKPQLTVRLKPRVRGQRALTGLRRVSRPGLRVYVGKTELPRVLGGFGISIISTSRGLMTGQAAQRAGLGGEVVAYVW